MYLRRKFGIVHKFINKLILYFKNLNPKYQFSLDEDFYDFESKKMIYCFKVYGDHSFVRFCFDDIKNDKAVLQNINPVDLIKIVNQETICNQKRNLLKINEHLRNNHYQIKDDSTIGILSGEEICDNIILIERMNNLDLYKIAYNTGFISGRNFTKNLFREMTEDKDNIVKLELVN